MKKENMNDLNKKLGFDVNEMKNAAQNGQLDEFVNKNLSQKATKQLKNVLSNKEACEKLLNTPQAKELMKKNKGYITLKLKEPINIGDKVSVEKESGSYTISELMEKLMMNMFLMWSCIYPIVRVFIDNVNQ